MAIEVISAEKMTSDATTHSARCVGQDRWVVSWLPGRVLTGEQAVTAMTIASTVASHEAHHAPAEVFGEAEWAVLDDWALELGLSARDVVGMIAAAPTAESHAPGTV